MVRTYGHSRNLCGAVQGDGRHEACHHSLDDDVVGCSLTAHAGTVEPDDKELRTRLGFKGVTVTDALEAGALGHSYSTGRRAVLAAGAGMDLLLCSAREVSQGEAAVTALTNALHDGTLGSTAFRAAVSRLTTLRAGLR